MAEVKITFMVDTDDAESVDWDTDNDTGLSEDEFVRLAQDTGAFLRRVANVAYDVETEVQ